MLAASVGAVGAGAAAASAEAAASGSAPLPQPAQTAGNAPASAFDPTRFVGPPEPPWLVGPPAPGIRAIAEGLYLVSDPSGNFAARVTPDGVLVAGGLTVDAARVAARIAGITDRPVRYVVRTHRRSGERPGLPATWRNATIVAPEPAATAWTGIAPAAERPDLSFTDGLSLFLGETEAVLRHFPSAHTGHDAAVLFADLGVLYAGELVVPGLPFIDYAAGGASRGWVEALDGILALDFDIVIPGIGPALTKRDAQTFRDRLVTLRMRAMQLHYRGVAEADALPLLRTRDLDWPLAPAGLFAQRSFIALYREMAAEREAARIAASEGDEAGEGDEETERP